jgi:dihydroorotate dehydrogenase (NAD+) catalytic subunit
VRIPVIGVGGIASAEDAVEFMMAGASAVQVGTASFVSPNAMLKVLDGLEAFCARRGFGRVSDLTGLALPGRLRGLELGPAAE